MHRPTDTVEITERINSLHSVVPARMKSINKNIRARSSRIDSLSRDASKSNLPVSVKLGKVWKIADEYLEASKGNIACKKGCSHCCHISVLLTKTEAELVGKRIGRVPEDLKVTSSRPDLGFDYSNPCPFLKNDACSIYEHRPTICRTSVSTDVDDLLCRLSEHPVSVPYASFKKMVESTVFLDAKGRAPILADIRDWFPERKDA